jgi:hypothetical protein
MKTGGASGFDSLKVPDALRRTVDFRVDLAGGLHRHVKKPRIWWRRDLGRHLKSRPVGAQHPGGRSETGSLNRDLC